MNTRFPCPIQGRSGYEIEDIEVIVSLLEDSTTASDIERKNQLLLFLIETYNNGINSNKFKTDYYLAKYLYSKTLTTLEDDALFFLGWFTSFRLGELRINRQCLLLGGSSFLPSEFTLLGLSYGLDTLVSLLKLFKLMYRQLWYGEGPLSNELWNTLSILTNGIIWFTINLFCYIHFSVTGCTPAYLWNLAGFLFDIFHDVLFIIPELMQYRTLLTKLKLDDREFLLLQKRITNLYSKMSWVALIGLAIFTGMAMFYFPISIPWLFLSTAICQKIGVGLVTLFGVALSRLGVAFFKSLKNFLSEGLTESLIKTFSEIGNFVANNIFQLLGAAVLLALAVTLSGTLAIGLGFPTLISLSFFISKMIIGSFKYFFRCYPKNFYAQPISSDLRNQLKSKLIALGEHEYNDDYNYDYKNFLTELKNNLSKTETSLLQQASSLNDVEWLKHIRNWGKKQDKENLRYFSTCDLGSFIDPGQTDVLSLTTSSFSSFSRLSSEKKSGYGSFKWKAQATRTNRCCFSCFSFFQNRTKDQSFRSSFDDSQVSPPKSSRQPSPIPESIAIGC